MSIYHFMGEPYARSRREAHRRKATLISPPTVSLCACIERPGNWQSTFEVFLNALLGAIIGTRPDLNSADPEARRAGHYIQNLARHYDVGRRHAVSEGGELTLEIPDTDLADGIWRVEVLRDYVSLTLHVGIHLGRNETDYLVTVKRREIGGLAQEDIVHRCPFRRSGPTNREAATGLNDVLFNTLATDLERCFHRVTNAIRPVYLDVPGARDEDLRGVVFAFMYSVLAPWTVLPDADPSPDTRPGLHPVEPAFPDFDAPGFEAHEIQAAQQQTNRFLTQHWEVLKGSLLSKQESDCVACYMMNGHGLYVSSLGSETSNPNEPIKYLLLYRDPATPADGERGVSQVAPCNFAWRLSRYVSRIHDIGAARLRALSQHEEISRFLVHGQDLEFRLAEQKHDAQRIKQLERRFRMITHAKTRDVTEHEGFSDEDYARSGIIPNTKPLMIRFNIVQNQYATMNRLSKDLGIISIPSYQDYEQFIRRRVAGPIELMLTAPSLYASISQKLANSNVRLQRDASVDLTKQIAKFQKSADALGKVLFIYYTMQATYYGIKYLGHTAERYSWTNMPHLDPQVFGLIAAVAAIFFVAFITAKDWVKKER
ncbi:hypothetical protein [Brevundimonas sp. A19_0]|uniref:hypothetical protein n=1 Tax=Brevundimonas sp. A19_0 TaxID=2821087 RepID=UPI001ADBBC3D|nr:hypothetical protein [Brevundimonas sp. A19_0]MBO9502276.1 hypothetical protein [Brevundimonas sp. A19_0]